MRDERKVIKMMEEILEITPVIPLSLELKIILKIKYNIDIKSSILLHWKKESRFDKVKNIIRGIIYG